ncbi:hypothetical protein BDV10DRAFT_61570 [Aspergillus recurvatus]
MQEQASHSCKFISAIAPYVQRPICCKPTRSTMSSAMFPIPCSPSKTPTLRKAEPLTSTGTYPHFHNNKSMNKKRIKSL